MKHNRGSKSQNMRCLECANPPCNAIGCATCKVCRSITCSSRNNKCTKPIQTPNSKILPSTHRDVLDFFCERCRFIRCNTKKSDGSFCSRERRHNAQAQAKKAKQTYTCGECQTYLFSQESMRDAKKNANKRHCKDYKRSLLTECPDNIGSGTILKLKYPLSGVLSSM